MHFKDPYSVLGVGKDASTNDIKRAYFDLVKRYHPDTNKDPEAKTKFIEIQNAYEILSDPKRKNMFDQYGTADESASTAEGHGGAGFGAGGFDASDIFRNIFTGGFGNGGFDIFGNAGFRQANLDVPVSISLSFLEAAKGATKTITFPRLETCSSCNGKGVSKGAKMSTCRSCRGTGQETRIKGSFYFSSTCRACGGHGQINPDPCSTCNGGGSSKRMSTVQVDIPSGVSEGEVFTVKGEGNRVAGDRGDLVINFTVEKSDLFVRKKNDIFVTLPITLYQAIKGDTVVVPTINGDVAMKIAPGTQPDDIKRLNGRGVCNSTTREQGHQFVKIKVEIPRSLTDEQLALLERCFGPRRPPTDEPANFDGDNGEAPTGRTEGQFNDTLGKCVIVKPVEGYDSLVTGHVVTYRAYFGSLNQGSGPATWHFRARRRQEAGEQERSTVNPAFITHASFSYTGRDPPDLPLPLIGTRMTIPFPPFVSSHSGNLGQGLFPSTKGQGEGLFGNPLKDGDTNYLDPSSSEVPSAPLSKTRAREKKVPFRSVSPANQGAGILFRMSPASLIESICVGNFDTPGNMSLAGQPIPPPSRDYGFSYVNKMPSSKEEQAKLAFPSLSKEYFSESDGMDEDFEARERAGGAPAPSGSGRGRGRKTASGPRLCISCGATKTPYWREAWSSSVLLCNACGLRYSKFRRRCLDCSYVPRKEDKGSKMCTKCSGPWS